MRALHALIVIPALALAVASCAHRHHGPGDPHHRGAKHARMGHHGGHGACSYKSNWFSEGAVRSNDGVCQSCSGGKWVAADGCQHDGCGHCDHKGMKGKRSGPCHHHDRDHSDAHKHPRRTR